MPQDLPDFFRLLFATVLLRPYVFIFFAAFLLAASLHFGWRRAVLFTVVGYLTAWTAEFSSIHVGIPFGHYYYISDPTIDRELWVFGVPFMDSLSFVFLAYTSFSLALLASTPIVLRDRGFLLAETGAVRRSYRVWLLTGVFFAFIDVVIDPVAYHGERWFLGKIYDYPEPGIYFEIPIANFLGWFAVGLVILRGFHWLEGRLERAGLLPVVAPRPFKTQPLIGPALYVGVLLFNLGVTFWLGFTSEGEERKEFLRLGLVGLFIFIPALSVVAAGLFDPSRRATSEEVESHLRDFPDSSLETMKGS